MKPQEFWDLHPEEFYWIMEARISPADGLTPSEIDELLALLEEAEAART